MDDPKFIVSDKEKNPLVLLEFSLTVKAATLIFISGCGSVKQVLLMIR